MTPNQIGDQLFELLEKNSHAFSSLSEEIKTHIKTLIDAQAENLGLVTRDEFDALRVSLDRAALRIAKLEACQSETKEAETGESDA